MRPERSSVRFASSRLRRIEMNGGTMTISCAECLYRRASLESVRGPEEAQADVIRAGDTDGDCERQIEQIERSFGHDWKW
jgi:hypothetical protein